MKSSIVLIFYYTKTNKYSFNALLGALETESYFNDLEICFCHQEEQLVAKLQDVSQSHEKIIIGFSFCTTQIWEMCGIVTLLRKEFGKKLLLIAGGPHPTGDPLGTLNIGFDLVVRGEGEETLVEVLQRIDEDRDFTDVKGLGFINSEGDYWDTGRRSWIQLDKYPPFAVKYKKFGHIEITRGCPYACFFCQTPHLLGGRPRHRSVENIIEYVHILKNRGLSDIRFITPNAFSYGSLDGKTIDLVSLEELLIFVRRTITPKGRIFFGSFPSEVRPEHVLSETLELVRNYADNDNLIIGAQSGSQRILDLCHRGHSVEDVYRAVEFTLKAGLKANVDFIFGLPGETEDDIDLTIRVMYDLVNMGARIHAHTFLPLPQTPFSKSPAGHVSDNFRRMITNLDTNGNAYGDWKEQERIAKRIAENMRRTE